MSVPETQRQKGKLEVLTKAKEVTVYSWRILANQKKFDPMYDEILGNDIKTVAKNIYRYARLANECVLQKSVGIKSLCYNKDIEKCGDEPYFLAYYPLNREE